MAKEKELWESSGNSGSRCPKVQGQWQQGASCPIQCLAAAEQCSLLACSPGWPMVTHGCRASNLVLSVILWARSVHLINSFPFQSQSLSLSPRTLLSFHRGCHKLFSREKSPLLEWELYSLALWYKSRDQIWFETSYLHLLNFHSSFKFYE